MEQMLNAYYENNARKLRTMIDKMLCRFGGISDKDYDDFYSIANEVFADVLKRFDKTQSFDGFLYACLTNRFKTELTARNAKKRTVERNTVSIDMPVEEEGGMTLADMLPSDFDMDAALEEGAGGYREERVERYLNGLTSLQRQLAELKMEGVPAAEIKQKLGLSDKKYSQQCMELKSFEHLNRLFVREGWQERKEEQSRVNTEKKGTAVSKTGRMSVGAVIKEMERSAIRFDHPLQRESDQWSSVMKGNLISDILQGNPVPALVFAEQNMGGVTIKWDLDGKQRCTSAYLFFRDGFRISPGIRRWLIPYRQKAFDIRGRYFSQLPGELQEKFMNYQFEIVRYQNCSGDDIAYHITRYNEGKPMTAAQKGIAGLGAAYAARVKEIADRKFFKDMGGYKSSELKNGTIYYVILESIMAVYFLKDWKTKPEELCECIRNHARPAVFDRFEEMVEQLEETVSGENVKMFNARNTFLWLALYAGIVKNEKDAGQFCGFMQAFKESLHKAKIGGVSYDDLERKDSRDQKVITAKLKHLEALWKMQNHWITGKQTPPLPL